MNIEAKLAGLEKQLRCYRNLTLGMLIMLTALLAYGAARPLEEVLRAKRLDIIGPEGEPVVSLQASGINGLITIIQGDNVLLLGGKNILEYSPNLLAGNLTPTVVISAGQDGSGRMFIRSGDKKSNAQIGLGIFKSGGGLLAFNRKGEDTIHLGANNDGEGFLTIKNRRGAGRTLNYDGDKSFTP